MTNLCQKVTFAHVTKYSFIIDFYIKLIIK